MTRVYHLIALFLGCLVYLTQASNIGKAQCSLFKAQVHLAYMGVLLSDDIGKLDGNAFTFSNENALLEKIAVIIGDGASAIVSAGLKSDIKTPPADCDPSFEQTAIATQLAQYAKQVLPNPIKIGNNPNYNPNSITETDLVAKIKPKIAH